MALRNQPYLSLYIQDYLTDEKLNCCSLSTQGVYIKLMCIFHKSENYGGILYKQIPKQNLSMMQYFAYILSKQTGINIHEIELAIEELLFFGVLKFDENSGFLYQKRMVKDNDISLKRSESAKKGGGNPTLKNNKKNANKLFKQNIKQNTEYENEYENEYEIKDIKSIKAEKKKKFSNSVKVNENFSSEVHGEVDDATGFIEYWTESGEKDKLLRFEKEKTFDLNRRLKQWEINQAKFKKGSQVKTIPINKNQTQDILEKYENEYNEPSPLRNPLKQNS